MRDYILNLDKNALIEHRIAKSIETSFAAKVLIDNSLFRHAENRIYYSIFYLVSALATRYDFSTSKHKELLGWFNKNFVHTGIVSTELKDIYREAFENRQEGDYEDFRTFELDEVTIHYERMLNFNEKITNLIRE